MKRKRQQDDGDEEKEKEVVDIVWQTPHHPPDRHDYIFCNGKRYVRPYYFEFLCHVKGRWAGKTIVDLFAQEFRGRPYQYYVSAVKSGRIQVDGEVVPASYIVKTSQKISHFVHRHEPPVMANDILILQKESDIVTICKPASLPVHPCGQYRKNTVVSILQAEHDLAPLFLAVHRLDRLVSGLLILARTAAKANFFSQQIEAGKVQKQYIAKVVGIFPEDEQVVDANVHYNPREGRSSAEVCCGGGPLSESSSSLRGKAACTKFRRIRTDGTRSIVLCQPITGRTHQIRVHLQYVGHPIGNDMLYLSEKHRLAQGKGSWKIFKRAGADQEALASSSGSGICNNDGASNWTDDDDEIKEEESHDQSSSSCYEFDNDPMCTNCPDLAPKGYEQGEGEEEEEGLWLQCIRYSGPEWTYECPYPDWAVA